MNQEPTNNLPTQNRASKEERSSRALTGSANPGQEPADERTSDAARSGEGGIIVEEVFAYYWPCTSCKKTFLPKRITFRSTGRQVFQKVCATCVIKNIEAFISEGAEPGADVDTGESQSGAGSPSAKLCEPAPEDVR